MTASIICSKYGDTIRGELLQVLLFIEAASKGAHSAVAGGQRCDHVQFAFSRKGKEFPCRAKFARQIIVFNFFISFPPSHPLPSPLQRTLISMKPVTEDEHST